MGAMLAHPGEMTVRGHGGPGEKGRGRAGDEAGATGGRDGRDSAAVPAAVRRGV
ncbi:hypothetical protein GCM10009605_26190 [Nocardiopsis composta]